MNREEITEPSQPEEKIILVCVDASEHSARAFNWYYDHYYREGHIIALTYVYAQPETPAFDPDNSEYQRRVTAVLSKSKSITRTFQEACAQRGLRSHILIEERVDTVGRTICKIAKEKHATCIVLGQRGMGVVKRTVLGSTSDYVIHHARIPVLIVPPPKEEKE